MRRSAGWRVSGSIGGEVAVAGGGKAGGGGGGGGALWREGRVLPFCAMGHGISASFLFMCHKLVPLHGLLLSYIYV